MVNAALIGTWHVHAMDYAKQAAATSGIEISVVWDDNTERGKALAEEIGKPFEADLQKILDKADINAVIITAATRDHTDIMIRCANAGKHIFTEKILALTLEECDRIINAVTENNVKFCISFPHRTIPENLFAKKVIDENLIGDVTLMRVRNAHDGSVGKWLPERFYNAEEAGGGAMIDLGAHPMYLVRWLMGRPKSINSIFTDYCGYGVDDNSVSVMEYENGAIAIAETGFVSTASPFSLELYGTKGTLMIGGADKKVSLITKESNTSPEDLPDRLPSAMNQWINAIQGSGEIVFDLDQARQLTEMMVRAYESYKTGGKVNF